MQFDKIISALISEMNQDEISKLQKNLRILKNKRDYARSKEEGGIEHVNLTNKIKKIQNQLKKITGKYE